MYGTRRGRIRRTSHWIQQPQRRYGTKSALLETRMNEITFRSSPRCRRSPFHPSSRPTGRSKCPRTSGRKICCNVSAHGRPAQSPRTTAQLNERSLPFFEFVIQLKYKRKIASEPWNKTRSYQMPTHLIRFTFFLQFSLDVRWWKKLKNVGAFAADLALFRWKQIQFWVNFGFYVTLLLCRFIYAF